MYVVSTSAGRFVIKHLNKDILPTNLTIIEEKEDIALSFKNKSINTISANKYDNKYLQECEGEYFLIFDFIEGVHKPANELTVKQAKLIGAMLAKLHQEQNNGKVISHCDINLYNLIWQDEENFVLIDWEYAGLINPYTELFSVALEVAGIWLEEFDKDRIESFILGYIDSSYDIVLSQEKIKLYILDVINESYIPWLNYCLGQYKRDLGNKKICSEIKKTIKIIGLSFKNINQWSDLIYRVINHANRIDTPGRSKKSK